MIFPLHMQQLRPYSAFSFGPLTARRMLNSLRVCKEEQKAGEGTRKQNLQGMAEETEVVWSREETGRRSHWSPQRELHQGGCQSLFSGDE